MIAKIKERTIDNEMMQNNLEKPSISTAFLDLGSIHNICYSLITSV